MRSGWRLATLGLVFLGLFGVLFFRLWFLQVAAGSTFEEEAQRQQVRLVATPAPRGEVRDQHAELVAGSRASLSILIDPRLLPSEPDGLEEVIQRLAALLGRAPVAVRAEMQDALQRNPVDRFQFAFDVTENQALFVYEHGEDLPGVVVEPVPVRRYPLGRLGAHVLGYIGRVTEEDDRQQPELGPLDLIGRAGVERQYDELLRGTPGYVKYAVNARGQILSVVGEQPSVPGANLVLTMDAGVQEILEESLVDGIGLARALDNRGVRAAGVVLDPRDGSVVAMASWPPFNPGDFVGGISPSQYQAIQDRGAELNYALQGLYPPGSTFKAVTYVAALEEDIFPTTQDGVEVEGPGEEIFCAGRLEFGFEEGSQQVFSDWKEGGHGYVDAHAAVEQSCDIYFWSIALAIWRQYEGTGGESVVQDWARRLGFGQPTGIDLPFERAGLVGDRKWFEAEQAKGSPLVRPRDQGGWVGGDLMNIVIGQGAVSATPLQLASAYAAIVNGGTLWQPRVADRALDQDGEVIFRNEPRAVRELDLAPATLSMLKADLAQVVSGYAGTARGAFSDFGGTLAEVGGKTGTAEADQKDDSAWFVGVAPLSHPEWVVAVVIEEGGSGGQVSAPVARRVLQYLMGEEMTPIRATGEVAD